MADMRGFGHVFPPLPPSPAGRPRADNFADAQTAEKGQALGQWGTVYDRIKRSATYCPAVRMRHHGRCCGDETRECARIKAVAFRAAHRWMDGSVINGGSRAPQRCLNDAKGRITSGAAVRRAFRSTRQRGPNPPAPSSMKFCSEKD